MTAIVPAYDVESPERCLLACREIARVHQEMGVPATFFLVGRLLETDRDAYVDLLGDCELFEVASHTYSHKLLREQAICGAKVSPEEIHEEIFRGKALVEEAFERECLGVRPGCSFENGLRGAPEVVAEVADAGLRYVSSQAWGPFCTLPAPLVQAYTYQEEGHPELWEFPCHGWHENVLKGHNATPNRLLLWPPIYPEQKLSGYVKTPQEEFGVHRFFVERALRDALEYVSLIWHPWSLGRFDPEMQMLRLVFAHAKELEMPAMTFADLWRKRAEG